jgi:hypothetical protein
MLERDPHCGRHTFGCSSVNRLVKMLTIIIGMKEEQQIWVMAEFGLVRHRTKVEVDWFVSIVIKCPKSVVTLYVYMVGCLTLLGLIKIYQIYILKV